MSGFEALGELKAKMAAEAGASAAQLISAGRYIEAASALDGIPLPDKLNIAAAYCYYRRGLWRHAERDFVGAVNDLHKARDIGGQPVELRELIQSRLTALKNVGHSKEVRDLDTEVAKFFTSGVGETGVLGEFMSKHGLTQPRIHPEIEHVDAVSAIGVYRWLGDKERNDKWSMLIREAKRGDNTVIALFARLLAEHMQANSICRRWIGEVDYIVPVPSDEQRVAKREIDVVGAMAAQLGFRLGLPVRADLIKRAGGSERSRNLTRDDLLGQYRMRDRKGPVVTGRNILLIDDVTTRGNTVGVCAQRLKGAGAARVLVLSLAQSESSKMTSEHAEAAITPEAEILAPWLCLADTPKLGPVRVKALLSQFGSPEATLTADLARLRSVSDIGPVVANAIVAQRLKSEEYLPKAGALLEGAAKRGAFILTLADDTYPAVLRDSNAAPPILFGLGDAREALMAQETIAIVGSRNPVELASVIASSVAEAFARAGWVIVSGLARGVDSLAHAACLEAGQTTMAFLGNGVDVEYPPAARELRAEIRRRGQLLSEYAFGVRTDENQLRKRNTLTVGASRAVIVIQTKTDGGTMNAARAAKTLRRPVFCVEPIAGFEAEFTGNAQLLKSGEARALDLSDPVGFVRAAIGLGASS